MSYIDVTGKTEDEAIRKALAQLGMDRDDVSVEILERAKSGFLGLGGNPARVRVTYADPEVEEAAPVTEVPAPVAEPAPVSQETTVFVAPVKPVEQPAPIPAPAAEPAVEQEEGIALDLEVEPEEEIPQSDPQSDTARIYGDSPFTPKPRFNFNDMRFGKQYDAESDND